MIARICHAASVSVVAAMLLAHAPAIAQPAPAEAETATPEAGNMLTAEDIRQELVGLPLCGMPNGGPLQGKPLCTVLLPDGSAAVAGAGILLRGVWEMDGDRLCRRGADDPVESRRCVSYERLEPGRYRNSDGVESCIGPCP